MREMKDSGIDTIGLVPVSWNETRLKYLCQIQTGNEDTQNANPDGAYPFYVRSPIVEHCDRYTFDGEGILVAGDGAGAGRIFHHVYGKYAVHQRVYRLSNIHPNASFIYYYISSLFPNEMDKGSAQSTVPSMRLPMLLNFKVFFPDKPEKVVTYLNSRCSEIDSLSADIQKQIDILNQYKKSVITEAVTKGLDKNAEMKDSGVEWIGEIPKEWDLLRIKYLFKVIAGGTPKSEVSNYWDGNIPWITPADYKTMDYTVSSGKRNITVAGLKACSTSVIPIGSIIFSKRAPIGTVAINAKPLCTNQGCLSCVKRNNNIQCKYFYYVMSIATEQFEQFGSGTTFKEISANAFANQLLPAPSIELQKAIVRYLDSHCSEIDLSISEKQEQLDSLTEYKKSLIYEYVTGKKEVPAV